jgi:CDGSH-type Zn-finger protein
VHGSPEVFDIDRKPWIKPDGATDLSHLKNVIERCPTGALHYHDKTGGSNEAPASINEVTIDEHGPIYIKGDIRVVDMEDQELFKDTRLAFCRCGASFNKPLCDNSHIEASFKADPTYNPERLELEPVESHGGPIKVKLVPNGPFVIEGNYKVVGSESETETKKKMSFCRCGASENKPFCDGSHKPIDFIA